MYKRLGIEREVSVELLFGIPALSRDERAERRIVEVPIPRDPLRLGRHGVARICGRTVSTTLGFSAQ